MKCMHICQQVWSLYFNIVKTEEQKNRLPIGKSKFH